MASVGKIQHPALRRMAQPERGTGRDTAGFTCANLWRQARKQKAGELEMEEEISRKRRKGEELITRKVRLNDKGTKVRWEDMHYVERRNIQAATLSRYRKYATAIIAIIETGIFLKHRT
jgi:hypothetical protein